MANEFTAKDIKNILQRRKKTAILTFVICFSILICIVMLLKPKSIYQSEAAIRIGKSEKGSIRSPSITTAAYMIKSFEVLVATAKKFALIPESISKEDILASDLYMNAIKNLENKIETENETKEILLIKVIWEDPIMAKNIANSIAKIYEKIDFYEKNRSIIEEKKSIEKKLKQKEIELEKTRNDLRNYRLNLNLADVGSDTKIIVEDIIDKQKKIKMIIKIISSMNDGVKILKNQIAQKRYVGWRAREVAHNKIFFKLNDKIENLILEEHTLLIDYNPEHPEVRAVKEQMAIITRQMLGEIESEIVQYEEELRLLEKDIIELRSQLEKIPDQAKKYAIMEENIKTAEELSNKLALRYQNICIQESGMVSNIELIRYAIVYKYPINQVTILGNIILGSFLAIIFAFLGGMIHEVVDTIPHRLDELAEIFGVPLLATISSWDSPEYIRAIKKKYPSISREDRIRYLSLSSHFMFDSIIAEQYRSIVPNLLMHHKEKGIRVVSILSALDDEGSSVFASNLAIALSQTGRTSVLVEIDFRNPSIHKLFGIENSPGLKDILIQHNDFDMVIRKVTDLILGEINPNHLMLSPGLDNFFLLTSGGSVENPSNYINSVYMEETIKKLKDTFDFVIINTPPALIYSEAFIAVAKADATILLTEYEKLQRKILHNFRAQLETLKVKVIGLVVNKIKKDIM